MSETIQSLRRRVAALDMAAKALDMELEKARADAVDLRSRAVDANILATLAILDAKIACYVTTDADHVKQACVGALYDVRNAIIARWHIAPTEDATPGLGEH